MSLILIILYHCLEYIMLYNSKTFSSPDCTFQILYKVKDFPLFSASGDLFIKTNDRKNSKKTKIKKQKTSMFSNLLAVR